MPTYVTIFDIRPPRPQSLPSDIRYPSFDDEDDTVTTLVARLERLSEHVDQVDVLYGHDDDGVPSVLRLRDGVVEDVDVLLSRSADRLARLPDAVSEARWTVDLPIHFETKKELSEAAADFASTMVEKKQSVVIVFRGAFALLTIHRTMEARLTPLFVWTVPKELRQWVRRSFRVLPGPSVWNLPSPSPSPSEDDDFESLVAYLDQGKGRSGQRAEAYTNLAKLDPARAVGVMLQRVDAEGFEVRAEIYRQLSHRSEPEAVQRLVSGFVSDESLFSYLSQVVYRNADAVETLVREHMVPGWGGDVSARVATMINDEWIRIPRAWIDEGPEQIGEALRGRLTD